jgi:16S rRNA (cytosine1402-N4)-methyltransferase
VDEVAEHTPERSNHDMTRGHIPVLLDETMELLGPRAGGRYIDATFGGGGHTRVILERSAPDGEVLALDADPAAIERAAELATEYGDRLTYRHNNFGDITTVSEEAGFQNVDGVLFDLGLSSFQFDEHERGFSLHADVPLDMRLNPFGEGPTAWEIVNDWDEASIVDILFRFGEENRARRIVRGILRQRDEAPIQSNRELAELIETSVGGRRGARIHPATKTFQALRIAVNRELDVLKSALESVLEIVRSGGRIVVISFHSLEDRIVKQFFQREARDCLCPPDLPVCRCDHQAQVRILTRRPITASESERTMNPRSRSAKLRAAERI